MHNQRYYGIEHAGHKSKSVGPVIPLCFPHIKDENEYTRESK